MLQYGKTVNITEGNLKIIDETATGNAPVLDIEMSEVLAPPDNAESRTRLQQQQTRNAGLAASTPKQDSVFRSPHPSVPIRRKTSQEDNSDSRSRTEDRRHRNADHMQLNANLSPGIAGHHLKAIPQQLGATGHHHLTS